MWTVIYVAQNMEVAEKIINALSNQEVLVKSRRIGKNKNGQGLFEILVPQSEVEDACVVLASIIY